MERYICIHGHFHQPPRENPWLETPELDDTAYPYHDWYERITAECYAPNGAARILDERGRIARIVNNYSRMSFDFCPRLLAWMRRQAPETYRAVIRADRESQERFSGHGSALAQTHDDVILPLCPPRDRVTQVIWGIESFSHHFGRRPEGLWLSEMAVDLATLEVLVAHGISFTIVAPNQALRVRPPGRESWEDVSGGQIDARRPYRQVLPSGASITLFFCDQPVSNEVAFERLLDSGEKLAGRLLEELDDRTEPQLVSIATAGETYGHHRPRGDMTLAYALHSLELGARARLTNYTEFLHHSPPSWQVEIGEGTSCSCPHQLGRWMRDCRCRTEDRPELSRGWRAPLRSALCWLRDEVAGRFDELGSVLLHDPWAARDAYIEVMLDRSPESARRFLERHAARPLSPVEQVQAFKLLEAERETLRMFATTAWSSEDLADPETVQVLACAGRAINLARDLFGRDLEPAFLELLDQAASATRVSGGTIYRTRVSPTAVGLDQVCAHYAVSSLIERHPAEIQVYCYRVQASDYQLFEAGPGRAVLGLATVTSLLTQEQGELQFGVLHLGGHHVSAGVKAAGDPAVYAALGRQVAVAAGAGDLPELVRVLDGYFGGLSYSVKSMFRDAQRSFMDTVLQTNLAEDVAIFRQVYDHRAPLMRLLTSLNAPLPGAFHAAAELVVNSDLRQAFSSPDLDRDEVQALLESAKTFGVVLDTAGLAYTLSRTIERAAGQLRASPIDLDLLASVIQLTDLAQTLPFSVGFWGVQNIYHQLSRSAYLEVLEQADEGDEQAQRWADAFLELGDRLGIRVSGMQEGHRSPTVASLVQEVLAPARIPRATYRLQLTAQFTLRDAAALVPYLDELGISDCYASPIFQARQGSAHGYDLCDQGKISDELGGADGFADLTRALREHRMGLLLDTVPNHMGIGDTANRWWMDVLENGPSSSYASYFDIEWNPVKPELANKVLLPILEDQYGRVLESGKLQLSFEEGSFSLYYYDNKLPLAPRTYALLLSQPLERLTATLGEDSDHLREYRSIITALGYLPPRTEKDPRRLAERNREKEVIKRRIVALAQACPEVAAAIQSTVAAFNGRVGDPASFDLLDQLISEQAYRPAFWRVAGEEINYRRFFDINDLAAIRTEDREVYLATHRLLFELVGGGAVTGLRIDHIDGLYQPAAYLEQLQQSYVFQQVRRKLASARQRMPDDVVLFERVARRMATLDQAAGRTLPLYVIAEKILAEGEQLPASWPVHGTTGYDFLARVNGLLVQARGERALSEIYRSFAGASTPFEELVRTSKKMTMLVSMASELHALSHQLERIAERNRRYRDFTLGTLTFALREVIACLAIYRTYVSDPQSVIPRDQLYIESAVAQASRLNPRTAGAVFEFIRETLLLRNLQDFHPQHRALLIEWVRKFQQLTGPVMAKGVEDTAFYVFNRLVSLSEVGGDPANFGTSLAKFHDENLAAQRSWPHTLLATSTHDTKRSEDVRARINVLSEMGDELRTAVERWRTMNLSKKTTVGTEPIPDPNDEYLMYQTLIGTWPYELLGQPPLETTPDEGCWAEYRQRITQYMQKATKEAKVHTSWVNPNLTYDAGVQDFVHRLLSAAPDDPFVQELRAFLAPVVFCGELNALSQTLLKLTSPGVPDFFQGSELWDLRLVDPDNRGVIDFPRRRQMLSELRHAIGGLGEDLTPLTQALLQSSADGRLKLFLIHRVLQYRRAHPAVFADGDYRALSAVGARAGHLCAFERSRAGEAILVVTPLHFVELTRRGTRVPLGSEVWEDTRLVLPQSLGGRDCRDVLTGQLLTVEDDDRQPVLRVASVLAHFPVALLEGE